MGIHRQFDLEQSGVECAAETRQTAITCIVISDVDRMKQYLDMGIPASEYLPTPAEAAGELG